MEAPELEGRKAVMFICGDDDEARVRVGELSDALSTRTVVSATRVERRQLMCFVSAGACSGLSKLQHFAGVEDR